ncbi:MAG: PaaI family thioesterase, partial [Gammaproteobacteria bacterium]
GYRDRVHGGITASILDEVMGWVPSSEYRRLCYSIELNVKYRRPVIVGHTYRVEGKIVEVRRRATRTEARVVDEAGATVYASATGVYRTFRRCADGFPRVSDRREGGELARTRTSGRWSRRPVRTFL